MQHICRIFGKGGVLGCPLGIRNAGVGQLYSDDSDVSVADFNRPLHARSAPFSMSKADYIDSAAGKR